MKYVLWSMFCGVCFMEYVLWSIFSGVFFMEYALWRMSYGVCFVESVLWSMYYGQCFMENVLWSMSYGVCFMVDAVRWCMVSGGRCMVSGARCGDLEPKPCDDTFPSSRPSLGDTFVWFVRDVLPTCLVSLFRLARAAPFGRCAGLRGAKARTNGGLAKSDLTKNKTGEVVSLKRSALGIKSEWMVVVSKAGIV